MLIEISKDFVKASCQIKDMCTATGIDYRHLLKELDRGKVPHEEFDKIREYLKCTEEELIDGVPYVVRVRSGADVIVVRASDHRVIGIFDREDRAREFAKEMNA